MKNYKSEEAIPKDIAPKLCEEIRGESLKKRFSATALQCKGCLKFSKGDISKMCIFSRSDYRGCNLVNNRYDRQRKR